MDLTRFIITKTTQVQERIQKHLQNILERPSRPHSFQVVNFIAQTDLHNFKSLELPSNIALQQKIEILFTQLTPFFDAGILFQKELNIWRPTMKFENGVQRKLEGEELKYRHSFPSLSLLEIKKAENDELLEKIGLGDFNGNPKISTLLMQPESGNLILLISQLADPWLKPHISAIQNIILGKILDDTL